MEARKAGRGGGDGTEIAMRKKAAKIPETGEAIMRVAPTAPWRTASVRKARPARVRAVTDGQKR